MSPKQVFLREATGLVRNWSLLDGWLYSIYYVGPTLAMAVAFTFGPWVFPGADMALGCLLGMIVCGFVFSLVYGMLGASMPRSGGDWIFQSRLLHPSIGYIIGFTHFLFIDSFLAAPLGGYVLSTVGISPMFLTLGYMGGNQALVNAGIFFGQTNGILIVQLLYAAWAFYVCVSGTRVYGLFMRWVTPLVLAGFGAILFMFTIGRAAFVANFNEFMTSYANFPDAYQTIINRAVTLGWNPHPPFSWVATFGFLTIASYFTGWVGWLTLNFGEIKGASQLKNSLTMTMGSQLFMGIYFALLAWLIVQSAGYDFLSSVGFLFFQHPEANPLPIAPYYPVLAGMVSRNYPVVLLAFVGGLFVMGLAWAPNSTFSASRALLMMNFDRLLPDWLGTVSDRFHTPVRIITLKTLINIIFIFVFDYVAGFAGLLGWAFLVPNILWLATAISAVVFPYRMRELYKSSPIAKYEFFGVPAISVCGVCMAAFDLYMISLFLTIPALGIVSSTPALVFTIGIFVISTITYCSFWLYRKRQGIDIASAFKQLPPE